MIFSWRFSIDMLMIGGSLGPLPAFVEVPLARLMGPSHEQPAMTGGHDKHHPMNGGITNKPLG